MFTDASALCLLLNKLHVFSLSTCVVLKCCVLRPTRCISQDYVYSSSKNQLKCRRIYSVICWRTRWQVVKTLTVIFEYPCVSIYVKTNRCHNERGSTTNYVRSSVPHCTSPCIYITRFHFAKGEQHCNADLPGQTATELKSLDRGILRRMNTTSQLF